MINKTKIYDIPAKNFFKYFDLPLTVHPMSNQEALLAHNHEFCEIVVIFKGHGTHNCNHISSPVTAGDVLFIPPGMAHGYDDTAELKLTNILYLPSRLGISGLDIVYSEFYGMTINNKIPAGKNFAGPVLHLNQLELAETHRLCRLLECEHKECAYGHEFASQSLFMALLLVLTRCYERCNKTGRTSNQNRIGNVIAYMNRHYSEKISLEILAGKTGMSQRNMIRLFEIATGTTPVKYLLHLRIYQASIMLKTTTLSISEIAGKCGFNDSNYFTRQFHRLAGDSPSSFRKSKKSANDPVMMSPVIR